MSLTRSACVVLVPWGCGVSPCAVTRRPAGQAPAASPSPQAGRRHRYDPGRRDRGAAATTKELLESWRRGSLPSAEIEAISGRSRRPESIELETKNGPDAAGATVAPGDRLAARVVGVRQRQMTGGGARSPGGLAIYQGDGRTAARWGGAGVAKASRGPSRSPTVPISSPGIAAAQAHAAPAPATLDLQVAWLRGCPVQRFPGPDRARQGQAMGGILVRDSPPIWSAEGWRGRSGPA